MDERAILNRSTQEKLSEPLPLKDNIILKLLDELALKGHTRLLEIGHLVAERLPYKLQNTENTVYFGAYGATTAATSIFTNHRTDRRRQLNEPAAETLNFQDAFFDGCFMVDQIYFWADPLTYFAEIYRVLKPGGKMNLAFVEKSAGSHLPWTQSDFSFYKIDEVTSFLRKSGFVNIITNEITATVTDHNGRQTNRPYIVISGQKLNS